MINITDYGVPITILNAIQSTAKDVSPFMKPFGSDVPEVEISVEEMMATNVSFDLHDEADVTGENALPFGHQSHAHVSCLAPFCIISYETTHIALELLDVHPDRFLDQ